MLQKYEGKLNFATDSWMSPNHKAYMVVTVHFKHLGTLIALLLNVVELVKLHTSVNLVAVFVQILREFKIRHKIYTTHTQHTQPSLIPYHHLPILEIGAFNVSDVSKPCRDKYLALLSGPGLRTNMTNTRS
jgi:hypothetical protein